MGKVEFHFPIKGKDTNNPIEKQPLLTSPYLENVRPWDVMEKRLRGGQRPAVRKWGLSSPAWRIGGNYRIDKLVKANRGTLPPDCHCEESCESQGYHWWDDDTCHTYPVLPGVTLPATLWKCVEDSNRATVIWSYDEGGFTYNVTVDSSGNIYITSWRTAGADIVHKLDSDANLLWSYAPGGVMLRGVAVDSSGNVYVTGSRSGNLSVWKLDSDGNLVASYDTGKDTCEVELDSSGNVFVTGVRNATDSRSVWKLDGDLNYVASYDTGDTTLALAIDGSDNIYIAGYRSGSKTVWKRGNDLVTPGADWRSYDTGSDFGTAAIAIDSSGNVIIGTDAGGTDGKELWQLDSSGNFNWYADCGSAISDIAIDGSDNIYVVGTRSSDKGLWVFDSVGNLLWSDDTGKNLAGVFFIGTNIYIVGARVT